MPSITLAMPDDWHCHFRNDDYLSRTVPDTAAQFARGIAMPNLPTPITTVEQALAYRERILTHVPTNNTFQPLMTLYLTEDMSPEVIIDAATHESIVACKLYPAGATTNATSGVSNLTKIYPLLEAMQANNLLLLVHGESIKPSTDIFDRESEFITQSLQAILQQFPRLRVVLEHISTEFAVDFVMNGPDNLAATITPHHLWLNRNDLLSGGIKPHYYCLPIVKTMRDQAALIEAATSAHPRFFLGTDSAPHVDHKKQSACGCAGIYSAHAALELYAECFDKYDALDKLPGFASEFGADFYQLPRNTQEITLVREPWQVPEHLAFGTEQLVPFWAGQTLQWKPVRA